MFIKLCDKSNAMLLLEFIFPSEKKKRKKDFLLEHAILKHAVVNYSVEGKKSKISPRGTNEKYPVSYS